MGDETTRHDGQLSVTVPSGLSGLPHYLNPILTPLARWLPPLAVVHHHGRTSENSYTTLAQAHRTPTGFIVGLAYTPGSAPRPLQPDYQALSARNPTHVPIN